jgi:DNA-binding response OmpR family regulator
MRILIVEDDPAIVRMLERGLAAHGYQYVSADNGHDGVLKAADEAVDLVLLDILLPGLDGQETLRAIRSLRPDLPVLMLTARDDAPNKARALKGGADGYLIKPFDLEELLARMSALLGRAD